MDRLRQLPVIGTAIRMQERYVDDAADALAASIGFFGFLSLFPLLALVLSVVGFVLGGDLAARERAIDLVTDSVPALSSLAGGDGQVSQAITYIAEKPGAFLSFGTIGLVLTGLRIASGAQQASAVVFRRERPTGLAARGEQVQAMVVVGLVAVAGAAVGGSVGVDLGDGAERLLLSVVGILVAYALDTALFLLAYRLFTPGPGPAWRTLLPGSLLAAAGWLALKLLGAAYIARQATSARSNYGALGSIIALLVLLYLAGRLYLYGAELAALLEPVDVVVPTQRELAEDTRRVPPVSPRTHPDVPPELGDAAKLAAASLVLGIAASMLGRVLRR